MPAHEASRRGIVLEVVKFTIVAILIITPFRFFVAQPFIVSGASMEPTLDPHEYLVIDQVTYRFEKPQRGDVVIFRYPLDPDVFFIKRIIGLPGEKIQMHEGKITVAGDDGTHTLEEPYAEDDAQGEFAQMELHEGEYFVLGDNRDASADSRVWGPVHERYLIGRALVRLFPFHEVAWMPGKYDFSSHRW